jgi:hypothetical protein
LPPDWGRRIEAAIKQQSVDLRRFMVATLDSFAARVEADRRHEPPFPMPAPEVPAVREGAPIWAWSLGAAAVCLLAGLCVFLWSSTRDELVKARAQIASLESANGELKQSSDRLTDMVRDLAAAFAATTSAPPSAGGSSVGPGVGGLPRIEPVPYGELPFDRGRLDVLREVLAKLEAQNYHGVVRVSSLPGSFCLTGNAADGFAPASAALPAAKCDLVGNPFEESLTGQQRQSLAFANLVAGVRQRTSGAITVVFDNPTAPRAVIPYPPRNDSLTAGEWNRAAAANNRVEFAAEPSLPPSAAVQ